MKGDLKGGNGLQGSWGCLGEGGVEGIRGGRQLHTWEAWAGLVGEL